MRSLWLLVLSLAAFTSTAHAAVWNTTERWSDGWEQRYESWIRSSWKVDVFHNPSSPYAGLYPDCADSVYSARIVFAAEHGLPFAVVDPSTQRTLITNDIHRFDSVPAGGPRVKAFLAWIYDVLSTKSLPNDSYPVAINRSAVHSGGFLLAKESKHSYLIKEIRENGTPLLYYSTQANRGNLKTRSWPSTSYLFSEGVKEPSGIRDFRRPEDLLRPVWEVPGYSDEQYRVSAGRWTVTMQARLARRAESAPEAMERLMNDVCELATTRIDLVNQAEQRRKQLGDTCLNAAEYDDLSTPSRDGQTRAAYQDLADAYTQRVLRNRESIPPKMANQLANIFAGSQSQENNVQFCVLKYAKGGILGGLFGNRDRTMTLGELRRRFARGLISANPNDPLTVRWGDERGPSEKARRCPTY